MQVFYTYPGMRFVTPYAPTGGQGLIAYTSNRGGAYDVWLYNPKNGTNQQLTNGLGESFSTPEWSPNSLQIAFVGRNRIIYIIDLSTGSIASIDQLEADGLYTLDWSPDSSRLVYSKRNQIVLYNVRTHRAQILQQIGATNVQWFPNGTELFFQAPDAAGISQLYRISTDGTRKQQLATNTNGPLNEAQLSPDGRFALYTTPGVSISLIHTLELSTGNLVGISGGPLAKNYYPRWAPNSNDIAFSATAFAERGYFSQIRTVSREGVNEQVWAISDCFATPVTWSSDGRKIAYLSGCSEDEFATEMWVLDLRHPVPIRIIQGGTITSLQWSPAPSKDSSSQTYTNPINKVRFQYPAHWQRVNDQRYEGRDGFFQISAIASTENIDVVCEAEAFHPLRPYGTNPRIMKTNIQNEEACLIFPSADQPAEMRRQAALIVTYPRPIEIEGASYNYFILWADEGHINEMSSTLVFLP